MTSTKSLRLSSGKSLSESTCRWHNNLMAIYDSLLVLTRRHNCNPIHPSMIFPLTTAQKGIWFTRRFAIMGHEHWFARWESSLQLRWHRQWTLIRTGKCYRTSLPPCSFSKLRLHVLPGSFHALRSTFKHCLQVEILASSQIPIELPSHQLTHRIFFLRTKPLFLTASLSFATTTPWVLPSHRWERNPVQKLKRGQSRKFVLPPENEKASAGIPWTKAQRMSSPRLIQARHSNLRKSERKNIYRHAQAHGTLSHNRQKVFRMKISCDSFNCDTSRYHFS